MIILITDGGISVIEMVVGLMVGFVLSIAIIYFLIVLGVWLTRRYEDWDSGGWWIWLGLIDTFAVMMICVYFISVVLFGGS